MIVEYKRDLYRNYLVVFQDKEEGLPYEVKMIQNNKIFGLLPMQVKSVDGKDYYYYDISSLQPCSEIYHKAKLSKEEIRMLIEGIIVAIEKGKEFLLKEDNFVLEPKYVYMNPSNHKVSLCYIPGYCKEIIAQFSMVLEFILDRVDYQEEQAVFLAYSLYKQNKDKTSTVLELKKIAMNDLKIDKEEKQFEEKVQPKTGKYLEIEKCKETDKYHEFDKYQDLERNQGNLKNNGMKIKTQVKLKSENLKVKEEEITSYKVITIVGSIGFILLGIIVISVLIQLGLFTNSMSGEFELTKFILFLGVIGIIEFSILRVWLSDKNKISKIKSIKVTKPIEAIEPIKPIEHMNNLEEMEGVLPEEVVYKYDIENSSESIAENTTLLVSNTSMLDVNSYCLNSCDSVYQNIVITEFPFFIGKLKTNVDYAINNNSISRYHAKIEKEEEHYFLTDLNSTNGTFINGKRINSNKRTEIILNDKITFAKIDYIFNKI